MRPIDRVIVKVNNKVYSFLDPLLLDETERPYCSNDSIVNKLAVVIPYNKDFINNIIIKSDKTFKMIGSSTTILSLNGGIYLQFRNREYTIRWCKSGSKNGLSILR